ncbi:MAG: hypothetical protein ACOYK8_03960 [Alphaproteobacteria bacterium]
MDNSTQARKEKIAMVYLPLINQAEENSQWWLKTTASELMSNLFAQGEWSERLTIRDQAVNLTDLRLENSDPESLSFVHYRSIIPRSTNYLCQSFNKAGECIEFLQENQARMVRECLNGAKQRVQGVHFAPHDLYLVNNSWIKKNTTPTDLSNIYYMAAASHGLEASQILQPPTFCRKNQSKPSM